MTNTGPSSVLIKFLALFLTDNVKSYIDEHPVDWVFHLKTFEENVGLEQSDGLRNILGLWQFQRLSFKIQTLVGLSFWPLIPCRLIQRQYIVRCLFTSSIMSSSWVSGAKPLPAFFTVCLKLKSLADQIQDNYPTFTWEKNCIKLAWFQSSINQPSSPFKDCQTNLRGMRAMLPTVMPPGASISEWKGPDMVSVLDPGVES